MSSHRGVRSGPGALRRVTIPHAGAIALASLAAAVVAADALAQAAARREVDGRVPATWESPTFVTVRRRPWVPQNHRAECRVEGYYVHHVDDEKGIYISASSPDKQAGGIL